MSKLTKKLVIFAAAMVMMLASSLTVFAKENEAVPRIVDNVMYVDEGSNNVWIYGVAVSIAGANKTDIVPNNPSTKIDVMANGKVFKQLDGVVLLKDEKKDRVFLEAGSSVIEAPAITDKALETLKKAIADGKADSITATQVLGTTADAGALAYQIGANGKVLTASGEDMATLLKTNANYKSVLAAFEEAVKAAEEAAKEAAESVSGGSPSIGESCGFSGVQYSVTVYVFWAPHLNGCGCGFENPTGYVGTPSEYTDPVTDRTTITYAVNEGDNFGISFHYDSDPGVDHWHSKPSIIYSTDGGETYDYLGEDVFEFSETINSDVIIAAQAAS